MTIEFTAYGIPAPKGSTKAFMPKGARFPVVTEDNKHTRPWANLVKAAAFDSLERKLIPFPEGPIRINLIFYMPRPKSIPARVLFHVKKPDLDKLVRAVKDALTGVIWTDDSQVIEINACKLYVRGQEMPRLEAQIMEILEAEAQEITKPDIRQSSLWACGMGQ